MTPVLLLDTATLVWVLVDAPRLGSVARAKIKESSVVHASAVSIAELTIKSMLGKIDVPDDLDAVVASQGLTELPLTSAHAAAMTALPNLARHDPFDRLLLAQAQTDGLQFLTPDRVLLGLGLPFTVDATV